MSKCGNNNTVRVIVLLAYLYYINIQVLKHRALRYNVHFIPALFLAKLYKLAKAKTVPYLFNTVCLFSIHLEIIFKDKLPN